MTERRNDVVRGNVVLIDATPTDILGNPVSPDSVTAFVTFEQDDGSRGEVELAMTQAGNVWSVEWDTNQDGIAPGDVYVSVRSIDPPTAQDFNFTLTANGANPDVVLSSSNWILSTGSWRDAGVWDDTAVWRDS